MADDDKDKGGQGDGGGGIKAAVREVLAELGITGGDKAGDSKAAPGDLNGQVAEAVRIVREGDAAARQREATEARIAALEAQKAAPEPEKAPAEHRGITRFFWGGDDDK